MEIQEMIEYVDTYKGIVNKIEKLEAFINTLNTSGYVQVKIPGLGNAVNIFGEEKEQIELTLKMITSHLKLKKLQIESNARQGLNVGDSEEFQKEHNNYLDLLEEFSKYHGKDTEK